MAEKTHFILLTTGKNQRCRRIRKDSPLCLKFYAAWAAKAEFVDTPPTWYCFKMLQGKRETLQQWLYNTHFNWCPK